MHVTGHRSCQRLSAGCDRDAFFLFLHFSSREQNENQRNHAKRALSPPRLNNDMLHYYIPFSEMFDKQTSPLCPCDNFFGWFFVIILGVIRPHGVRITTYNPRRPATWRSKSPDTAYVFRLDCLWSNHRLLATCRTVVTMATPPPPNFIRNLLRTYVLSIVARKPKHPRQLFYQRERQYSLPHAHVSPPPNHA